MTLSSSTWPSSFFCFTVTINVFQIILNQPPWVFFLFFLHRFCLAPDSLINYMRYLYVHYCSCIFVTRRKKCNLSNPNENKKQLNEDKWCWNYITLDCNYWNKKRCETTGWLSLKTSTFWGWLIRFLINTNFHYSESKISNYGPFIQFLHIYQIY